MCSYSQNWLKKIKICAWMLADFSPLNICMTTTLINIMAHSWKRSYKEESLIKKFLSPLTPSSSSQDLLYLLALLFVQHEVRTQKEQIFRRITY